MKHATGREEGKQEWRIGSASVAGDGDAAKFLSFFEQRVLLLPFRRGCGLGIFTSLPWTSFSVGSMSNGG